MSTMMGVSSVTLRRLREAMQVPQDPHRVASSYALRSRLDAQVRLNWSRGKRIGSREFRFVPQREDNVSFIAGAEDTSIITPYLEKYAIISMARPLYASSGMYAQYTYLTPE